LHRVILWLDLRVTILTLIPLATFAATFATTASDNPDDQR